jgi:hypothetical protein
MFKRARVKQEMVVSTRVVVGSKVYLAFKRARDQTGGDEKQSPSISHSSDGGCQVSGSGKYSPSVSQFERGRGGGFKMEVGGGQMGKWRVVMVKKTRQRGGR